MKDIILNAGEYLTTFLTSLGIYGPIVGSFLILIESIVPVLPISVFIALNFYVFGQLVGFIISYILTVVGCMIAYYISKRIFKNRMDYLKEKYKNKKIIKTLNSFSNLKANNLAVLLAFPFTPAFVINIVAGVSDIPSKKYLVCLLVSKPFLVYFWGYLGVTFIEAFSHPIYFVKIIVMLVIAYVLSNLINKKFNID